MFKEKVLLEELLTLRSKIYNEGQDTYKKWKPDIKREEYKDSALNFAYYLALRRRDIRRIQESLMPYGLSSLGRIESKTINNLDAVIKSLSIILGEEIPKEIDYISVDSYISGDNLLKKNNQIIFGPIPEDRNSSIMVTLSNEAAKSLEYVKELLKSGMNVVRINCSHDDVKTWEKMIKNVKKASEELDIKCKISMDIAGPKTRIEAMYTTLTKPEVKIGDEIFLTGREKMESFYNIDMVIKSTLPEVIPMLKKGDPVLVDDGMIEGEVKKVYEEGVVLEAKKLLSGKKGKIRIEKGLNFPKTNQDIPILTEKDLKDLEFIAIHSDIIGLSFVRDSKDIERLQNELSKILGEEEASKKTIMAKIETVEGVNNLPEIIVKGASKNPFCVMIARGDLAVESGYLRLSELQEEILWICEAAQIPVIWATEVLRSMAKTGIPTRAEITDAAMASRADCVMLNKGKYINETIISLVDILKRMKDHQYKKTSHLRALEIAKIDD